MTDAPSARYENLRLLYRRVRRPAFLGTLRRTTPISRSFGYDRGEPIDRYYIERFLEANADAVTGRVLEVKGPEYTRAYGHDVTESAVLDIDRTNEQATIYADLASADAIESNSFDCVILTQTLQLIYDVPAAVRHAHRILKPGGALLVTVPVVSRVIAVPGRFLDYWRFTEHSCQRLFSEHFENDDIAISIYGNVLSCIGFLTGLASQELTRRELQHVDSDFCLLVGVRAQK